MAGRAPLTTLPNGSPNKADKCAAATVGKPAPLKRATPAKGRKRGPRPAQPAQTLEAKTGPSAAPPATGSPAAAAATTQVCCDTCLHEALIENASFDLSCG
jgi:hypothetical protein